MQVRQSQMRRKIGRYLTGVFVFGVDNTVARSLLYWTVWAKRQRTTLQTAKRRTGFLGVEKEGVLVHVHVLRYYLLY